MLSFFIVSHIMKEEHGEAYPDKGGYIAGSSSFLNPILLLRPTIYFEFPFQSTVRLD